MGRNKKYFFNGLNTLDFFVRIKLIKTARLKVLKRRRKD